MKRATLSEGLEFSRIVYGMWRLAEAEDTSPAHVQAKIEACLEQGITTFDQADIYGGYQSEAVMGEAMKVAPSLRDKMEIVTKCDIVLPMGPFAHKPVKMYDTSRAHIVGSLEASLKAMAIDRVDLLLIHRPDPFMDPAETGAALDEVVASGKAKAVGVSNFKLHDWTLLQSNMESPLVTNQIEISLLAHEALTNGDLAYLQERKIKPMAWSPLAGGALFAPENAKLFKMLQDVGAEFGVDATAVAVAWLLAHPAGILPVLGTNNLDRIRGLGDALKVEMTRELWFTLYTEALGDEVP
ncbi:aldo/keto reductase family oxidoreductase [Pseudoruegeria sp. SHC-113]|uniref:aldo/keto reductase n=1 Tax=Pseudoruegeria sp. SHC-113 TaxID=2855439 RepID=UPI0021BAACCE|nr:aldo/keto reductase [Pseudoruegeria sp. SHC-113]MCT8160829.1 aldo/keto reductase [Pseudoruegeria sp. SHC-113]